MNLANDSGQFRLALFERTQAKHFHLLRRFARYSYGGFAVPPHEACVMAPAHPVKTLRPSPQPRRFLCAYSN